MKKYLLLFSTLLTLYSNGQTSVYHPFPDSNAIWNVTLQEQLYEEHFSYTFSGDSLINGVYYHKISKPFIYRTSNYGTQYNSSGYAGCLRQDTTNKKVYFISANDSIEQLLYNFNLHVGDTLKGFAQNYNCPIFNKVIISTDSILVDNSYRKRWNTNNYFSIIEGIGSTLGLLDFCNYPLEASNLLTCFRQNGQSLYPSTTWDCELITSINSIDKVSNKINIFPNPSNDSFTADFDQSIKSIWLTDLLGNIIFKHQTNNQTKFNIDNLSGGTYILTAIDKDGSTTNKKIISCP